MTSSLATAANYWYLSDRTLIGEQPSLRLCMAHLRPRLAAVGSALETGKTHLWGPGAPDSHFLESVPPEDPPIQQYHRRGLGLKC